MKKKIMLMLLGLFMSGVFSFASTDSDIVRFVGLADRYRNKLSVINFYNGVGDRIQNTHGFILVKGVDSIEPETLFLNGKRVHCEGKLRGYYVNLARGNYLYPLSPEDKTSFVETLNGDADIEVTGGFYTSCEGNGIDNNSIIGYLSYKINGIPYFKLYAGFKFDVYENKVKFDDGFVNNLKLVNGTVPIGFIYDTVGGVGFWGGMVDTNIGVDDLNDLANRDNLNISIDNGKITVENNTIVSTASLYATVRSLVGIIGLFNMSNGAFNSLNEKKFFMKQISVEEGTEGKKRISYNANLINFSDVNNMTKKNAEKICRNRVWKEINRDETISNLDEINCFKGNGKIIINYDPTYERKNTIIVSKGVDVIITTSMEGDGYMEMYIDKARLLINNNINLLKIGESGEPVNNNEVTSGAVIKGLFVINGLIGGYENGSYTGFKHKLYVLGQFASLNTLSNPNPARVSLVRNLLGQNVDDNYIGLSKVFKWECKEDGIGTDGVNCSNENDKWWQNSVIFITKKYSYKLLK